MRRIHRWPVNSSHKRGIYLHLMTSLCLNLSSVSKLDANFMIHMFNWQIVIKFCKGDASQTTQLYAIFYCDSSNEWQKIPCLPWFVSTTYEWQTKWYSLEIWFMIRVKVWRNKRTSTHISWNIFNHLQKKKKIYIIVNKTNIKMI